MLRGGIIHAYPSLPVPPEILPGDTVQHPDLRTMLCAWMQIGDKTLPQNPDAILKPIKSFLHSVHLSDVLNGGKDFRFRVIGVAVFPGLEENQTGRLISQHPDPGISLRFTALMQKTVEIRAPVRGLSKRITDHISRDFLIESLWLPFGTNDEVKQIMSMAVFSPLSTSPLP